MWSIANDHLVFDNKETITWTNIGSSTVTINNVVREPSVLQFNDSNGSVVYVSGIEFLIWKYEASNNLIWGSDNNNNLLLESVSNDIILWESFDNNSQFIPRLSAEIIDNLGKKYKVNSIDDGVLRSRWSVKAISVAAQGTN